MIRVREFPPAAARALVATTLVAIGGAALAAGGCDRASDGRNDPPRESSASVTTDQRIEVVDLAGVKKAFAAPGSTVAPSATSKAGDTSAPRAILVNFWATWCAPCVAELPDLLAAAKAPRERGELAVFLVSFDLRISEAAAGSEPTVQSIVPTIREFLSTRRLDEGGIPVLIYDDEIQALLSAYDLPGPLPTTIVLDAATGQVIEKHEGAATRAQFDELIRKALARK